MKPESLNDFEFPSGSAWATEERNI
jgi:hypothetical protein